MKKTNNKQQTNKQKHHGCALYQVRNPCIIRYDHGKSENNSKKNEGKNNKQKSKFEIYRLLRWEFVTN